MPQISKLNIKAKRGRRGVGPAATVAEVGADECVSRRRGMSPTHPGDRSGEFYDGFSLICFPSAAADLY